MSEVLIAFQWIAKMELRLLEWTLGGNKCDSQCMLAMVVLLLHAGAGG